MVMDDLQIGDFVIITHNTETTIHREYDDNQNIIVKESKAIHKKGGNALYHILAISLPFIYGEAIDMLDPDEIIPFVIDIRHVNVVKADQSVIDFAYGDIEPMPTIIKKGKKNNLLADWAKPNVYIPSTTIETIEVES